MAEAKKKHLIVIHGRSTKPSQKEKTRLVRAALLHGLERVDAAAADKIRQRKVAFTFVYYGDISNRLILEHDPKQAKHLTGRDEAHDNTPCIPDKEYDALLEEHLRRRNFTKKAYKKFLADHADRTWYDNAASVISGLAAWTGVSDNIVAAATPDMGAYLLTRKWGSEIRERLQRPLKRAFKAGDDICLVAHSMGTIVAYDVLWKFSSMSEYKDVKDTGNAITLWLTLGCPLGEPGVRKNLYDGDEREDGLYPRHIIRQWLNIAAYDDFVAHDPTVKNDFKEMERMGLVDSIRDQRLYNFWRGAEQTNPHKLYGYLDHPTVAQHIANWMA